MFSFGIEPSMTSTNGFAASPRAAARNGVRNSSPPSVGESTLLWRLTFGIPGIAPSSTSSMPGWPAAVTDTESPSQLIPSEIQRMSTSSTPATGHSFRHGERVDEQLLAAHQLHIQAPARRAREREVLELALRPARPAHAGRQDLLQHQFGAVRLGSLRDEAERGRQRAGHTLAQEPDLHLDALDPPPVRVPAGDADDGVGQRELVHQQILGSGSPTSSSITRLPPKLVSTSTMPGGSVRTSPMSAASGSNARSAASAASAHSGATSATSLPSLATYIGSMPSSSDAPATAGLTGTAASLTSIATPAARASSLSTEATPPRVASRMTRTPPASSSASTAGHRQRVSETISASRSNSPRASMIAVPCSPIAPESRIRSPGRAGANAARGSRRPMPVVQTYMPSAWPRSTPLVSPVTTSTPAAPAAVAIASTSKRGSSADRPSSRISASDSASGFAPAIASSLTVPLTANSPIEPPGKRSGLTTNESVVSARSPTAAASSSASIPNAGASRPSISLPVALPPAPWAIVMRSSRNFARLPRAVSMIPRIRCSRSETEATYTTSRSRAKRPKL